MNEKLQNFWDKNAIILDKNFYDEFSMSESQNLSYCCIKIQIKHGLDYLLLKMFKFFVLKIPMYLPLILKYTRGNDATQSLMSQTIEYKFIQHRLKGSNVVNVEYSKSLFFDAFIINKSWQKISSWSNYKAILGRNRYSLHKSRHLRTLIFHSTHSNGSQMHRSDGVCNTNSPYSSNSGLIQDRRYRTSYTTSNHIQDIGTFQIFNQSIIQNYSLFEQV